jgi:para-nitrobenzyl esterase
MDGATRRRVRRSGFLFGALLMVLPPLWARAAVAAPPPVVRTTSGDVRGVDNGTSKEWRGVPFAAPPVGNLRWRPPAAPASWTGVRDASTFAPPCIQLDAGAPGGTRGSENCLYLNVFAPSTATASSKLPVMVHIHGGGNTAGAAYTDARALTSRNVMVVTLQYRLGALGFIGHPKLSAENSGASGEYGLLDQLAALRWLQSNITAFGGDKARVTLFGVSAGSYDAVAIMASPMGQGLLQRAAIQSEHFRALTGDDNRMVDAERLGVTTFGPLGCQGAANELACLRAKPADAVVKAADPELALYPWIDGQVLPRTPLKLVTDRETVPLLIGHNREDDRAFIKPKEPFTPDIYFTYSRYLVGRDYDDQARDLYRPEDYPSRFWAYVTMETDAVRGCQVRKLTRAVKTQVPVYRYLYTHVYQNDPGLAGLRASHFLEDFFLWHAFADIAYTPTAAEEQLSKNMTDYWTNFAKTANPDGPGLLHWPRNNRGHEPTLVLNNQLSVTDRFHDAQCNFLDTVPEIFPKEESTP